MTRLRSALVRPPALALLCFFPLLTACPPPPPTQGEGTADTGSSSDKASPASSSAQPPAGVDNPAAEAFVLIQDNKERCLKVSRDASRAMEEATLAAAAAAGEGPRFERSSATPRRRLEDYIQSEGKSEFLLVDAVEEIVRQALGRMNRNQQRDLSSQMSGLFQAQQRICDAAKRAYVYNVEDYRGEVSAALYTYTQTEQRITSFFRVSDAERQKIHRQHEKALLAMAQAAGGTYRPMLMGTGSLSPVPEKTAEQWAAERREYEEKMRRREQMSLEHRRSVDAWRDRDRAKEEMPSVGVAARPTTAPTNSVLKPKTANSLQKQMDAWHRDYFTRSRAARNAIQSYLDARRTGNLQVIENACRQLKTASDQLMAKRGVLYAPDPSVQRDLEEAYSRFQAVGTTCRDDQAFAGSRALDRAALGLQKYGLRL